MSPQWESNAYAKIHANCGGLVYWIEAFDNPHVGYTGKCTRCDQDGIPTEEIMPVECPDGMIATDVHDQLDIDKWRDLNWPIDAEYDEKQAEVQELITA